MCFFEDRDTDPWCVLNRKRAPARCSLFCSFCITVCSVLCFKTGAIPLIFGEWLLLDDLWRHITDDATFSIPNFSTPMIFLALTSYNHYITYIATFYYRSDVNYGTSVEGAAHIRYAMWFSQFLEGGRLKKRETHSLQVVHFVIHRSTGCKAQANK